MTAATTGASVASTLPLIMKCRFSRRCSRTESPERKATAALISAMLMTRNVAAAARAGRTSWLEKAELFSKSCSPRRAAYTTWAAPKATV